MSSLVGDGDTAGNALMAERTCSICLRVFANQRGVKVHARQKHPEPVHAQLAQEMAQPTKKARWNDEETYRMASAEAIYDGADVNQHLSGLFSNRSLEAIKGKRRQKAYKDSVAKLRIQKRGEQSPDTHPTNEIGRTHLAPERSSMSTMELGLESSTYPLSTLVLNSITLNRTTPDCLSKILNDDLANLLKIDFTLPTSRPYVRNLPRKKTVHCRWVAERFGV